MSEEKPKTEEVVPEGSGEAEEPGKGKDTRLVRRFYRPTRVFHVYRYNDNSGFSVDVRPLDGSDRFALNDGEKYETVPKAHEAIVEYEAQFKAVYWVLTDSSTNSARICRTRSDEALAPVDDVEWEGPFNTARQAREALKAAIRESIAELHEFCRGIDELEVEDAASEEEIETTEEQETEEAARA